VYLLLSHEEGVKEVKSLLQGGNPLEFLPRMKELYRSLPMDTEATTTRIGEGIKELDGYLMVSRTSLHASLCMIAALGS
jgi:hypothetical protein